MRNLGVIGLDLYTVYVIPQDIGKPGLKFTHSHISVLLSQLQVYCKFVKGFSAAKKTNVPCSKSPVASSPSNNSESWPYSLIGLLWLSVS